jgi:hypothetical protein
MRRLENETMAEYQVRVTAAEMYKPRRCGFWKNATPTGRYRAYDVADTIAAAKKAYSRCRTRKDFLLTADAPDRNRTRCAVCSEKMCDASPNGDNANNDSGHFTYDPRTKKVAATHYYCGWTALMTEVFTNPAFRNLY